MIWKIYLLIYSHVMFEASHLPVLHWNSEKLQTKKATLAEERWFSLSYTSATGVIYMDNELSMDEPSTSQGRLNLSYFPSITSLQRTILALSWLLIFVSLVTNRIVPE